MNNKESGENGAVVAWVSDTGCDPIGPSGTVLVASGCFVTELADYGDVLGDHVVPRAPRLGLLVFEGTAKILPERYPDADWVGEWRPLTRWELLKIDDGRNPLENGAEGT